MVIETHNNKVYICYFNMETRENTEEYATAQEWRRSGFTVRVLLNGQYIL